MLEYWEIYFKEKNAPRSNPKKINSYIYSYYFPIQRVLSMYFFCRLNAPFFMEAFSLYSLFLSFHLSLPLVRLNITFQASFPHKCGQLVRCRVFNMVVVVFFSDISQFTIDSSRGCLLHGICWVVELQTLTSHSEEVWLLGKHQLYIVIALVLDPSTHLPFLLLDHPRAPRHPQAWPITQYSYSVLLSPQ